MLKTPEYYKLPNGDDLLCIFPRWVQIGFCIGNIFKYVWRAGKKTEDPLPDLRKAAHYLDFLIGAYEREQDKK